MLKFKSLASQLCGIFPYICLEFALGSFGGFQTILIAELHKKDSEIPTTDDQLSWFASLNFVKLIGSMCTGLLMHHLGSRLVALIASSIYITSLLLYHYTTTLTIVFVSRILSSLMLVYVVASSHISEISEPHLRGRLLVLSILCSSAGSFFSLLLGSLMYWRTIALVNLIFPIVAAVAVLVTPNSPTWLANRGRLDEAKKALCWLRGWVQPDQVQSEFQTLVENVQKSKLTSQEHKLGLQVRLRRFFQLFTERSFYLPLGTMFIIFLLHSLGGSVASDGYTIIVFHELKSPIEESYITVIMGAVGSVTLLIILLSIRHIGKRKLSLFSLTVASSCEAVIATVGFLELSDQYLWIPSIAMIVASVANRSVVEVNIYMLNSEIFPSSVRYIGTSISIMIGTIMSSTTSKLFLYLVDVLTWPGIFLFFAFVNFVSLVVYYLIFPETEGKSLKEIEDHFSGVKNLAKRGEEQATE